MQFVAVPVEHVTPGLDLSIAIFSLTSIVFLTINLNFSK